MDPLPESLPDGAWLLLETDLRLAAHLVATSRDDMPACFVAQEVVDSDLSWLDHYPR